MEDVWESLDQWMWYLLIPSFLVEFFCCQKSMVAALHDLLDTDSTFDFEMIGWSFCMFISQ